MEQLPKVSIIMCIYNGGKYVREAVDSILNQTFTDFEFIIINDGSKDKTKEILESYADARIKIHHQENIGLTKSLNRALSFTRGKYIARQDADDVSMPLRIEEQVKCLDSNRDVVLVGTGFVKIDESGAEKLVCMLPENDTMIRWKLLFDNCFCHTSVMVRASTIYNNKLFYDEKIKKAQDYDLWSRLLCHGKGYNIQKPFVKYRIHNAQISCAQATEQKHYAMIISQKNIVRLGLQVSAEAIPMLLAWETHCVHDMDDNIFKAAPLYVKLLKVFSTHNAADPEVLKKIKIRFLENGCWAVKSTNIFASFSSGLLMTLIRLDKTFVLKHFLTRILNKLIVNGL
ncbi:MAG: glycosyltransferase family 2 protein [Deltaproteobacteria bacterium]|nr:glycosyltransferase family 2 protein [Deltaproteobacteria bacterium]